MGEAGGRGLVQAAGTARGGGEGEGATAAVAVAEASGGRDLPQAQCMQRGG